MTKYRLTKITVTTKEIISLPGSAIHENADDDFKICQMCRSPLLSHAAPTATPETANHHCQTIEDNRNHSKKSISN